MKGGAPSALVAAGISVAGLSLLVAVRAFVTGQDLEAFSNGGAAAAGAVAALVLVALGWPARLLAHKRREAEADEAAVSAPTGKGGDDVRDRT
ncbi:MAG: hypothetical protein ACOYKM_04835 [Caulobacterales bacterium]